MLDGLKRYFVPLLIRLLPETKCFALKRSLYRLMGYQIGENTRICSSARLFGAGEIIIGSNVWIGPETMILTAGKVVIGDNVDLAPRVYIGTGTHNIGDIKGRVAGKGVSRDIHIEDGCWLGSNVIVQPGVTVSKMTMVNSGSIVTKQFEPYSMLAGVPAKLIREIKYEDDK